MGCGCNKSKNSPSLVVKNNVAALKSTNLTEEIEKMNDENMILTKYMHPNRGQHPVRGHVTKTFYGYRAHGDTFLVHAQDIKAQPHWFVPVDQSEDRRAMTSEPAPRPVQEFDAEEYLKRVREKFDPGKEIDLQSLPGVTPTIAKNMKNSGFTTKDAIVRAGAKGLQEAVNGIGEVKAEMIVAYLESIGDE